MTIFNYILDNDLVFYSLGSTLAGFMCYRFVSSVYNSYYIDKGVQTDAWEDYSERLSQLRSDSLTSIDTVTHRISPIEHISQVQIISSEGTQTITDSGTNVSTVITVLPIPPVNIEMIPNPDIINTTAAILEKHWAIDYYSFFM